MSIIQAIILGIVQGLTEMLPISSSAHLTIIPWIFNWNNIPEAFDVALHFGTLLAIGIYFFKEWINLISKGIKYAVKKEKFDYSFLGQFNERFNKFHTGDCSKKVLDILAKHI